MTKRPVVICGSGGFAREVVELLSDVNQDEDRWDLLGFLDDDVAKHGQEIGGLPVLGAPDWLRQAPSDVGVLLGIGSPVGKFHVIQRLREIGVSFPVIVHPNAVMSNKVTLGDGALVTAGNILTTNIHVGEFVTLNLACTVGHDVRVERFATILPGVNVSGNVVIGQGADVGTGSTIIQGVRVGQWSIIGAGSVVIRDVPADCTAVGSPARPIKQRLPGWHLGEGTE